MARNGEGSMIQRRSEPSHEVQVLSLTPRSGIWIAAAIFGSFFALELARNVPDTLARVALGVTLAFALDPLVTKLRNRLGCSRGKAVFVVGAIAALAFALLIAGVGPRAIDETRNFGTELPKTIEALATVPVIGDLLDRWDVPERIREFGADLPSRLDDTSITDLVETLVGGLMAGLTVIVVAVAVLADGEVLVRRLRRLVPERHKENADTVGQIFRHTIGAYFAGSLLVSSLAATFVLTVGLALGVPLAPVAALWVLVVSLIPQIGGFLSASVFAILGFAESPTVGIFCFALYFVYMTIENHVIQPLIVGKAIDLSAPATMLAALVGAAAIGVPGAIIGAPLAGTAKALYSELREARDQHAIELDADEASEPTPNRSRIRCVLDRLRRD